MDGLSERGVFVADRGNSGLMRPGTDRNVIVMFSRKSVLNEYRSQTEGRPVYEPVDYVRVQQPGERDYQEIPATENHKMRWPHQWDAFERGNEQVPNGTPLDVLFPGEPHIVATLKQLQILTAEHLAEAGENALSRIGMGARMWKTKAARFIENARTAAPLHAAEALVSEQKERIAALEATLAQLNARMSRFEDDDEEPQPRRRRVARASVE